MQFWWGEWLDWDQKVCVASVLYCVFFYVFCILLCIILFYYVLYYVLFYGTDVLSDVLYYLTHTLTHNIFLPLFVFTCLVHRSVYLYKNQSFHQFSGLEMFVKMGYDFSDVVTIGDETIQKSLGDKLLPIWKNRNNNGIIILHPILSYTSRKDLGKQWASNIFMVSMWNSRSFLGIERHFLFGKCCNIALNEVLIRRIAYKRWHDSQRTLWLSLKRIVLYKTLTTAEKVLD